MYVFTSAVMFAMILTRKPKQNYEEQEQMKLGGYLALSTLIVSLIKMIFTSFYIYDLIVALTLSVTTYIFYKIFVNSTSVIREYEVKKVFSIEEVVGASLLVTIAVSALGNLSIFSFSIRNIICIFIVLMLGYRNGILLGGISGITVGIVLGIIGNADPIIIGTYAISGMIAGLLNRFGKIGVIVGFFLGNIIITYAQNGGTNNIIKYQEILIAAIGLLALPKNVKLDIDEILPKTKLLPEASKELEEGTETILKLNTITKTLDNISKNTETKQDFDKNEELFEDEVSKQIEGMENNILYDYFAENENNLLNDTFENIIDNGILTENGMISILAKHNIYVMNSKNSEVNEKEKQEIRDMIKAINSAFRICKNSAVWQKKIIENNNHINSEINNVKQAINDIKDEISTTITEDDKFKEYKTKIINVLKDNHIELKDLHIKQEKSGKYIVNATANVCDSFDGKNCPMKKIQREISRALDEKVELQNQVCGLREGKSNCEFTFTSCDKYVLQIGMAKAKKDDSIISGDMTSSVRLNDGKYMLAISDGMGTGPDAKRNSNIAISMLERLLTSGFNKETSINLINSAILSANKEEMYATLDVEILDLFAGKIEILKNGACPTYIKRNKNVIMVKSNSLPTGIVDNVKIDTYDKDLEDGDIIVICSDGILESNKEYQNPEQWLKYLLEDINTDSPERIADIILKESVDNDFGKPKDDMSVIAIKVSSINK